MTSIACFCLSLSALAAGETPTATDSAKSDVTLRVHVLDMEGIEWRGDLVDGLQVVEHKAATSVWTADAQTLKRLIAASARCAPADAAKGAVGGSGRHFYVDGLKRRSDAPPGKATWLAFQPTVSTIDEGVTLKLATWTGEQGVLADIAIEDTHLVSLTTVNYTEELGPALRTRGTLFSPGGTSITAQLQVPEVIQGSVRGEWLIPAGNALVVGLGVHTYSDSRFERAVIRERVVILDAGDLPAAVFTTPTRGVVTGPNWRLPDTILIASSAILLLAITFAAGWSLSRLARCGRAEDMAEFLVCSATTEQFP